MPTLEIDSNKRYMMPNPVFVVSIDNKFLAIARETGNWVLLENDRQRLIYDALSDGHSVVELFDLFSSDDRNDIIKVLTELEAKRFECTDIQYPQQHGIYIYLTNQCNQRCRHCYMYAGDELDQELSTNELQTILEKFSDSGGQVVTFTGGEATLRPDFATIVQFAKKVGLQVCVLSNGLLWTDDLLNCVKTAIDEVQISIDGFDRESYKQVRGTDSFDKALSTVDNLVSAGIRTTVAVSPLLDTLLEHEHQYITFAKELSSKYSGKTFFVKFNTELMEGRNIVPTEQENQQYRMASRRIKDACAPFAEEEGFAIDHVGNTVFHNCGYGGITITANGDVYFCSIVSKCTKQANVRTESFESILEKSKKAMALSKISNLIPCSECPLKFLCGGGCRIKNFRKLVETFVGNQIEHTRFSRDIPCTQDQKEKFYRLMVKANSFFYR
ncbi:radical SAM protein [Clostridiaceae bacterium]|nr:radical SAM protein [Clostridiaceae bacterium]